MNPFDELRIEARVERRHGNEEMAKGIEYALDFLREKGVIPAGEDPRPAPARTNTRYTEQENDLIRRMWGDGEGKGEPISKIAQAIGRGHLATYKQAVHVLKLPRRPGDSSLPAPVLPLINGSAAHAR